MIVTHQIDFYYFKIFTTSKNRLKVWFYNLFIIAMRKITQKAVDALLKGETFNESNTTVSYWHGLRGMELHGNHIASYDEKNHKVLIKDAWRKTKTTQERLNWILTELRVWTLKREKWFWYINSWKDWKIQWDWNTLVIDLWEY